MTIALRPAHRLARINYAPRAASFALAFVVVCAVYAERGFTVWDIVLAALCFLVYPHLAYLSTRLVPESKQAELNNLYVDAVMLGAWAAQLHFARLPTAAMLIAVTLNNATHGGAWRALRSFGCFAAAAAVWGAAQGYRFEPQTGQLVGALTVIGLLGYVSWFGTLLFVQNRVLARLHLRVQDAERQFYFLAENASDLVCVLDVMGRFRFIAPSHEKYFDPIALGAGSLWLGLIHPDDHERARAFLERITTTRARRHVRLRMLPREGPPQYVECNGSPIKDDHDEVTGIVVITQRLEVSAVAPQRE